MTAGIERRPTDGALVSTKLNAPKASAITVAAVVQAGLPRS